MSAATPAVCGPTPEAQRAARGRRRCRRRDAARSSSPATGRRPLAAWAAADPARTVGRGRCRRRDEQRRPGPGGVGDERAPRSRPRGPSSRSSVRRHGRSAQHHRHSEAGSHRARAAAAQRPVEVAGALVGQHRDAELDGHRPECAGSPTTCTATRGARRPRSIASRAKAPSGRRAVVAAHSAEPRLRAAAVLDRHQQGKPRCRHAPILPAASVVLLPARSRTVEEGAAHVKVRKLQERRGWAWTTVGRHPQAAPADHHEARLDRRGEDPGHPAAASSR